MKLSTQQWEQGQIIPITHTLCCTLCIEALICCLKQKQSAHNILFSQLEQKYSRWKQFVKVREKHRTPKTHIQTDCCQLTTLHSSLLWFSSCRNLQFYGFSISLMNSEKKTFLFYWKATVSRNLCMSFMIPPWWVVHRSTSRMHFVATFWTTLLSSFWQKHIFALTGPTAYFLKRSGGTNNDLDLMMVTTANCYNNCYPFTNTN